MAHISSASATSFFQPLEHGHRASVRGILGGLRISPFLTLEYVFRHSQFSIGGLLRNTGSSHIKVRSGPAGIQLFNRVTGLNILLDEIEIPPESWASAPRHVSIALTNACDLACPYCYAPKAPHNWIWRRRRRG